MALTWDDLNGKVQDKIIPTVADVVYKSSPVFIRIRTNNGQQFDGGIKIRQNIGYAELNGGPFGRGEPFNTDYVQTDTAFAVDPKFYYVNISLYGTDDVLARGPMQAVPFVGSKIANAAGKMAKLLATDMYLDGLGTNSSTKSIDGSTRGPAVRQRADRQFSLIKLNPEMGTDCKQFLSLKQDILSLKQERAAVTTERENIRQDDATVCSHANAKRETATEMIAAGRKPSNNQVQQWFDNGSVYTTVGGLTRSDLGVANGKFVPF